MEDCVFAVRINILDVVKNVIWRSCEEVWNINMWVSGEEIEICLKKLKEEIERLQKIVYKMEKWLEDDDLEC